jgi:ketol-acid reductoisomerase
MWIHATFLSSCSFCRVILGDIQSGKFVKEWMLENKVNQTSFKAMRTKLAAHPAEAVGANLREMMPWIRERAGRSLAQLTERTCADRGLGPSAKRS